jgi:hypothetical protein
MSEEDIKLKWASAGESACEWTSAFYRSWRVRGAHRLTSENPVAFKSKNHHDDCIREEESGPVQANDIENRREKRRRDPRPPISCRKKPHQR